MTEFLTAKETAQLLRLSVRRVQELAAAQELKSVKPFGRVLIYKNDVAEKLGIRPEEL